MSALNTSIYWVEYVARHGNTLQSPAVHMHWWQWYLLDVYGFILGVFVATLYIMWRVLRTLRGLLYMLGSRAHATDGNSRKNK